MKLSDAATFLSSMGKREVWVRSASVVPKFNNRSIIPCYIRVREMPIVPKCNNESLIHGYVWVRQLPIVPRLHHLRFNGLTFIYDRENNIVIVI